MEGDNGGARLRPGRGPPAPPPPPGHEEEEANGGHRRGGGRQTRQMIIWRRRLRHIAVALTVMFAAALYLLFGEALAAPAPVSAAWFFVAFALWIVGLNMLYYSWMNMN